MARPGLYKDQALTQLSVGACPLIRPILRAMWHAQDHHTFLPHFVDYDVGARRKHQLVCPFFATASASVGEIDKPFDRWDKCPFR